MSKKKIDPSLLKLEGNREQRRKQQRKAEKIIREQGVVWDDVESTYQLTAGLVQPINAVIATLIDPTLRTFIHPQDTKPAVKNVQLLTSMVSGFKQDLEDIHKNHEGKAGPVDLMDYGKAMEINEKYLLLAEEAKGAFAHPTDHLIDIIHTAHNRMRVYNGEDVSKPKETIQESVQKHLDESIKENE